MKPNRYRKILIAVIAIIFMTVQGFAQEAPIPTLNGPVTYGYDISSAVYSTDPLQTGYNWTYSSGATLVGGDINSETITIDWSGATGPQTVTVDYEGSAGPTSVSVGYYPFAPAIDPTTIPQFINALPHFAAGLRVDAKAGGNLVVRNTMVQQIALPPGTPMPGGRIIGDGQEPVVGLGNYAAYSVSTDGGSTFGPAMWPAQTIEAQQGNQLVVEYRNELFGKTYADFNILADQTLMMNGYNVVNENIDPYTGPIPMSVHLHGGEMPSDSDGGPTAWFMPGTSGPDVLQGPGFAHEASTVCTYPNLQEGTTLWYHPHDQGLTRINVYTGLAGYYFLRGANEDALQLPGWSGDGLVQEITPTDIPRVPVFNGTKTYKPEVEIAIQDRMFNVNGGLYWPVAPTNPDVNPYWTPEFVGDVMTVNGKAWPYLSVAPRKYAFRMLDGCNARFLNMWLSSNPETGVVDGPPFTILSTEGGFLDIPVTTQILFLAPAERPIVIIDFTGYPEGTVFTLMNDANSPYPTGDPVIPGLTDRIMQFVVNGIVVTPDNSVIPGNLRPAGPMIRLTDFAGTANVTPVKTRQLILNEIIGAGGPVRVAINNSHFDDAPVAAGGPTNYFGGPTEMPQEGTTEMWQIMNTTADAHPIHPHLVQFQLVGRQVVNTDSYMAEYDAAWAAHVPPLPVYPDVATYPGGAGPPYPYDVPNTDGAVGGNPPFSGYLGSWIPALPEEQGWKDAIKSLPGHVETYMVRLAPTDKPLDAAPLDMVFPFDPSLGPGYVYHCHIIDHEDMDMMRPMLVAPSPVRAPSITANPAAFVGCVGETATFGLTAESANPLSYQWQESTDGVTWANLANGGIYSGVDSPTLSISSLSLALNSNQYQCFVSTSYGTVNSFPVALTVNARPVVALIGLTTACATQPTAFTTDAGMGAYVWTASGGGVITGGTTNAPTITWPTGGVKEVTVNYTAPNGCSALTPTKLNVTVDPLPTLSGPVSACVGSKTNIYVTEPGMTAYTWVISNGGAIKLGGTPIDNTVTVQWVQPGPQSVSVNYTSLNGCIAPIPIVLPVTVLSNTVPMPIITGQASVSLAAGGTGTYSTGAGNSNYVWGLTGSGGTITPIAGSTHQATAKWTAIGSKKVTVSYTDPSGCPSPTASYSVKVLKSAEIALEPEVVVEELKFEGYPIPTDGLFMAAITSPVDDTYEIQIFNSLGTRMYQKKDIKVNGLTETSIDLRNAPEGMYFVVFLNDKQHAIKKLIIHK